MSAQKIIFISTNSIKTKKLAEIFAEVLIQTKIQQDSALIIGLFGNLGSGKTTFVQGFAKGFKIKERVQSPTFVIFKKYDFHKHKIKTKFFKNLYHFDCYRISNPKEILNLGFKEIIKNPYNIVLIEWADKIKKILPKKIIKIRFQIIDENKRRIRFEY